MSSQVWPHSLALGQEELVTIMILNVDQTEFIVHTDSEYNSYVHPRLWSIAHSCVTLWFIVYTLHLNCDYWSRGGRTQLTFAYNLNQFSFVTLEALISRL